MHVNSNKMKYIHLLYILIIVLSCKENTSISHPIEYKSFPEKDYQIDETGNIISTEIDTSDFASSDNRSFLTNPKTIRKTIF